MSKSCPRACRNEPSRRDRNRIEETRGTRLQTRRCRAIRKSCAPTTGFATCQSQSEARIDRGAHCVREEVIRPIATEPPPDFPSITDPPDPKCQGHIQLV